MKSFREILDSIPITLYGEVGDKVYYKKEGEWRGSSIVIGRDGKVVIVKHGSNVREVRRVHITRLRGTKGEGGGGER